MRANSEQPSTCIRAELLDCLEEWPISAVRRASGSLIALTHVATFYSFGCYWDDEDLSVR
jgi:hypothetical protein